jgi:hypothetical protein
MGFWGRKKKAAAVAEPYLNKHGWKASDPLVRHPWPPSQIEFAVLRTSETISATTWPKLPRGYNQETSRSPAEYHVDRSLEYDGCVITLDGVSRVGASWHLADVHPDKLLYLATLLQHLQPSSISTPEKTHCQKAVEILIKPPKRLRTA